jgi:8-oxo-dGTP pyrophosphatase MutT (NUDIX family)
VTRAPLSSRVPRAVAVVERDGKLLVIRRHLDGRDYAVLPGGGIEPGESPADAAVRELAEECTLDGKVERVLFEADHGDRMATYFLMTGVEGEPVLGGGEATQHGPDNSFHPLWATPAELDALGLLPEGIATMVVDAVWPLTVEPVDGDDWPVVETLWQLYQHDLSEFRGSSPGPDGRFRTGHLPFYDVDDPDAVAYLARRGDRPLGFCLVRGVEQDVRTLGEFFVARSARGGQVARLLAETALRAHPGPWWIAFQDENPRAARFWRRLGEDILTDVREERRAVQGKPHLPPDVWLHGIAPQK